MTIHLHHPGDEDTTDCRVWCGLPCGSRETTAYPGLDPERVTCVACLVASGRVRDYDTLPVGTVVDIPATRGNGTRVTLRGTVAPWHTRAVPPSWRRVVLENGASWDCRVSELVAVSS
jgi:hypothetical protein